MTAYRLITAIVAAALAAVPSVVSAKTLTNTMNARIQVDTSCRVFTEPLAFGNANIFSGTINATATIRLRCGPNVAYAVAINNGQNANGAQRRMYSGAPLIPYVNYQIYRNAARDQIWGATAATDVNGVTPTNGDVDLIMYGQVPGGLIWPAAYTDVVTVTVTF